MKKTIKLACPACGRVIAASAKTLKLRKHKPFARGHVLSRQNNHTWCAGTGMAGDAL